MDFGKCAVCGFYITEQSNFCKTCGNPLVQKVKFIQAIEIGFRNMFNFDGRATRAEFWWWHLFIMLFLVLVGLINFATTGADKALPAVGFFIWNLVTTGLCLSVSVRRLHDTNRRGWWAVGQFFLFFYAYMPSNPEGIFGGFMSIGLLATIVPFFWLIICACRISNIGTNPYGPDPRTTPR